MEGSSFNMDEGHTWQKVFCNDCGNVWNEIYEPSHRETLEGVRIPDPILKRITDAWNKVEGDDGDQDRTCAIFFPESGFLNILQCWEDRQDELSGRGSESPHALIDELADLTDLSIKDFTVTL